MNIDDVAKATQLPNSWEERGSRKGIEQEREAVVLKMLEEGLSIDVIAKVTDLEKELLRS